MEPLKVEKKIKVSLKRHFFFYFEGLHKYQYYYKRVLGKSEEPQLNNQYNYIIIISLLSKKKRTRVPACREYRKTQHINSIIAYKCFVLSKPWS